jgi:hypothetical protein
MSARPKGHGVRTCITADTENNGDGQESLFGLAAHRFTLLQIHEMTDSALHVHRVSLGAGTPALGVEGQSDERFALIEVQTAETIRVLNEHSRVLERVSEAVRGNLGLKPPRSADVGREVSVRAASDAVLVSVVALSVDDYLPAGRVARVACRLRGGTHQLGCHSR